MDALRVANYRMIFSYKLCELGFTANDYECCVYNKYVDRQQVSICIHIDDLFVTPRDPDNLDGTVLQIDPMLKGRTLHRDAKHSYLGMIFDFSTKGDILIAMDGYVRDFFAEYSISGTAPTPAKTDLLEINTRAQPLDDVGRANFHSPVAKILLVAKRRRPDLLTAESFLSTRVQCPTTQDLDMLQRLLK